MCRRPSGVTTTAPASGAYSGARSSRPPVTTQPNGNVRRNCPASSATATSRSTLPIVHFWLRLKAGSREKLILRGSSRTTITRVRVASPFPLSLSSPHSTPGAPLFQTTWWASDANPSQRDGEASRRHHVSQPLAVATASVLSAERPETGREAAAPAAAGASTLPIAIRRIALMRLFRRAAGHLDPLNRIGDRHHSRLVAGLLRRLGPFSQFFHLGLMSLV